MYFGDELGDSPIPSESGARSESGSGSPASEVRLRKSGFPRIVGSGSKVPNRNREGLSNPTERV